MTFIVGIGHRMRVGKDTSAHALVRDLGFVRIGLADSLKELALEADPLIHGGSTVNVNIGHGRLRHIVHGMGGFDRAKSDFPEVRRFLQALGLGARKVFGEEFWVERTLAQAARFQRVVIPDVRFKNEAEAVKSAGGLLIRIDRPGEAQGTHVSETELAEWDGWDHVIANVTDIADLERKVVDIVRPLLEKPGPAHHTGKPQPRRAVDHSEGSFPDPDPGHFAPDLDAVLADAGLKPPMVLP